MDSVRCVSVCEIDNFLNFFLRVGPMLWSPLSETPYIGRMPIYLFTLFLFIVLQVPTALATNFGMLLAFRFITGFVGSPVLSTGGATVVDMYAPKKQAYGLTVCTAFATCAPAMGPVVGGFAAHAKGWRWPIWELTWLGGFTFILLFFFFPETSSSSILYHRAVRLRKATGDKRLKSMSEIEAESMSGRDIATIVLVRPFTLNFQEPIVLLLNVYIGLIYALFYLWFESFPVVFVGIYHFKEQFLGLAFLGILGGMLVTIPPFFYYLYNVQEKMFDENGQIKPEKRMIVAIFGSFFVPVCLFWFGWTSQPSIHWIVPILGSALSPVAGVLLFVSFVLPVGADAEVLWLTCALRRMRCWVTLRTRTLDMRRVYSQGTLLFVLHSAQDSRCLGLQCITI
jgi:DHA1 family multidrug resistance protein-like MFS transporter